MKVKFKGGRELEVAIKDLGLSVAKNRGMARRALTKAALPIQAAWKAGVDEDSGDLKRSIEIGDRAATKATRKFRRSAGQDIVERYIGIDLSVNKQLAIYAEIEEMGSLRQPPNPAGRNAWESNKMQAMDDIRKELWTEIQKAAKKAKK